MLGHGLVQEGAKHLHDEKEEARRKWVPLSDASL